MSHLDILAAMPLFDRVPRPALERFCLAMPQLDGWDLSAPELDLMTVVVTEDQRRHPRNRRP